MSSNLEQKQARLKQFLYRLSEDPSLSKSAGLTDWRPLSELLLITGYQSRNESVDMAELVSLMLKKKGLEEGSEDMMDYIVKGGTVDDFMTIARHSHPLS
ncbi:hypothetical protein E5161_06150 [Cohnella pontilimi]|uniref:Uncharacterized protein n=1 Tax=Cohnella pontilimi TaxID=2564100 RepID=A0A4U0FF46_9BACL|nr:hypothetical protein [Cohnella pontilimi]TJY43461.1 hypothetical protein E5161_06150 [Cohnella pontilimi]